MAEVEEKPGKAHNSKQGEGKTDDKRQGGERRTRP